MTDGETPLSYEEAARMGRTADSLGSPDDDTAGTPDHNMRADLLEARDTPEPTSIEVADAGDSETSGQELGVAAGAQADQVQRLRDEAASAEGSFTKRVKEARANELEAAGTIGEVATQQPASGSNPGELSDDPRENPDLALEMASAEAPAKTLIANIIKTSDFIDKDNVLELLDKKADELAEIGRENYLGEAAQQRRQERRDREEYRQAREYVISKILSAPASWEFARGGVLELADLSLIGHEGGRTQIGRDEYGVTPVFGYEITREQTHMLRQEIYEMLGSQIPSLEGLKYEDDFQGDTFIKKTASLETPTSLSGIVLVEGRTNWYRDGDASRDSVVLSLKKVDANPVHGAANLGTPEAASPGGSEFFLSDQGVSH